MKSISLLPSTAGKFSPVKIAFFAIIVLFYNPVFADALDDATAADLADLCQDKNANELYKIANKNSNSQALRREALERMQEVSRQCSSASDNKLKQFHHKAVSVAHDLLTESELDTRRIAIDTIQFVVTQPDTVIPAEGSITRGQALSNAALNDSDTGVRLWALEALVTLRSDHTTVQSTLASVAANDSEQVVRDTASDMLNELF
ncbi:hypothetical protein P886_1765 [Alteromonadaceae bacterium 2753L.S.0a.02]|nr:hypothetical protein P886_1765 [Alteromonadaceae bacterium 2753L.S.0a.02]